MLFCVALFGGGGNIGPATSSFGLGGGGRNLAVTAPSAALMSPVRRGVVVGGGAFVPSTGMSHHGRVLQSIPPPALPRLPASATTNSRGRGGSGADDAQIDRWLQQHKDLLAESLGSKSLEHTRQYQRPNDGATPVSALSTHVVGDDAEAAASHDSRAAASSTEDLLDTPPFYRMADELKPQLIHTVQQRADTSYIFCTEVQVATARLGHADKTLLSLVMPTPQNGTTGTGVGATSSTKLVQVDCEVTGSRFIHHSGNVTAATTATTAAGKSAVVTGTHARALKTV